MTKEELDFIGSMNMCDEISNEAYKKIVCHCGEQDPCEDAISRQDVIDAINTAWTIDDLDNLSNAVVTDMIKALPPVNPQPKTGHWINGDCKGGNCSICGEYYAFYPESGDFNYCPNCGAKMVESEDKE